jgi:signal transduction histidine kinase
MELKRRNVLVYGLLAGVWILVAGWQVVEHYRVKASAREAVTDRSKYIADITSGVIGSASFRGIVLQDRLESALNRLVKPGELISAALLNASNEVVAAVGAPIGPDATRDRERWGRKTVSFVNPVDLSASLGPPGETNRPTTIVVAPRREPPRGPREAEGGVRPPGEPPPDDHRPAAHSNIASNASPVGNAGSGEPGPTNRSERRPGRLRFGRPPWMSEEEYKSMIERRGLHGLILVMSTEAFYQTCAQDLWMRLVIGVFASIAVVGLGTAWRNLTKSSDLQVRLVRASEMNMRLKEMNLAAAGLAHETRNPLNIIRGMAQMISREADAAPEVRRRSREIVDETDRVTAQLNEFINYSRPREVRRAPVALDSVVAEVVRALNYDLEEKHIRLRVPDGMLTIEADEQLLRQALFNLLLNAVQAVEPGGEIEIAAERENTSEASLEIRDNGPGVLPDHRAEIFKPYFTTHQNGTGLGLAVVQQIVLAHGWEIECGANQPRGAIFRITHLKPAAKASRHGT